MKIENVAQAGALILICVTGIAVLFVVIAPIFTGTSTTPFGAEIVNQLLTFSIGLISGAGIGVGYSGIRMMRSNEMLAQSLRQNVKE